MYFSFIVPYRNRDALRVQNCLQSIDNQSIREDIEIVFVDYGSLASSQSMAENLCGQFATVRYFYFNTQYQFWSRAHAINLGVQKAKGEYIIIVDVDLVYPPNFASELKKKIDEQSFVQYQCYYMPENQKDYTNIDFTKSYPYKISSIDFAAGLIALPSKKMYEIGGYDEYFKVWGVEDMDFKKRLLSANMNNKVLSINECPTFHQWHAPAYNQDLMPALWLSAMEKYAQRKASSPLPYLAISFSPERTSLLILEDIDNKHNSSKTFCFEYPTLQSFVKFSQAFFSLQPNDVIIINQEFTPIVKKENSRLGNIFSNMNRLLEKIHISYRMTEIITFETEMINFTNVRDFIFYFIAENQEFIADYALDTVYPKKIVCVLIKK
jgi:glycosyltransferase involved in cell wall biosynthesis